MHLLIVDIAQLRAHELARNAERREAHQRHAVRLAQSGDRSPRRPRYALPRVWWAR